jgi:GNAT superfamily N-acetyltransferase
VQVKCFGCDQLVEASSADEAAAAFLAHARDAHSWTYPEQALAAYARNYAEACGRISTDTERRAEIGPITIHPVTSADRVGDWLTLFDVTGFAGNPDWASCYCLDPNVPATPEAPERPWRESRAATAERLRCGATFGYLAYVDNQAAGWVNASKRSEYGLFRDVDPTGPSAESVIGVACFVIAPPYRRHGVASALLDRVIADAGSRGASWIESYPHNAPDANGERHFRGSRSMYEARGFKVVEVRQKDTVMRRRVDPVRKG